MNDSRPAGAAARAIIPGFHPDPSICRVGERFYVANSSFEYSPAVPVWASEDLLTWSLVGHALGRESQFPAGAFAGSMGVFAPTLRHHAGLFWMITTIVGGEPGQVLVTAEDPAGEWSLPVRFSELEGIDPDIAWDDDGRCLVTYCGRGDRDTVILQAEVDPSSGAVLEEPRSLWSGTGLAHPEAPHLYRRDGWWYLMIAEGGTERGHTVAISRARDPRGPFEAAPRNPILTHRSTNHPVQNTGHADLVERPDGSWAMVYLAVRTSGRTPGFHVNGRETFLAGVEWNDDWPRVDEDAFDVPATSTAFHDDFSTHDLDLRWVSPGDRLETFVELGGSGARVSPVAADAPTAMIAARVLDARWQLAASVEPCDGTAELRLHLDDRHWYAVRADGSGVRAVVRIGDMETVVSSRAREDAGPITLCLRAVDPANQGPDDIELGVEAAGHFVRLARLDGRYLSTEVAGGFTGRVVGVRALDGPIVLTSVDYRPGADTLSA